jgi:hypothetical protein
MEHRWGAVNTAAVNVKTLAGLPIASACRVYGPAHTLGIIISMEQGNRLLQFNNPLQVTT